MKAYPPRCGNIAHDDGGCSSSDAAPINNPESRKEGSRNGVFPLIPGSESAQQNRLLWDRMSETVALFSFSWIFPPHLEEEEEAMKADLLETVFLSLYSGESAAQSSVWVESERWDHYRIREALRQPSDEFRNVSLRLVDGNQ